MFLDGSSVQRVVASLELCSAGRPPQEQPASGLARALVLEAPTLQELALKAAAAFCEPGLAASVGHSGARFFAGRCGEELALLEAADVVYLRRDERIVACARPAECPAHAHASGSAAAAAGRRRRLAEAAADEQGARRDLSAAPCAPADPVPLDDGDRLFAALSSRGYAVVRLPEEAWRAGAAFQDACGDFFETDAANKASLRSPATPRHFGFFSVPHLRKEFCKIRAGIGGCEWPAEPAGFREAAERAAGALEACCWAALGALLERLPGVPGLEAVRGTAPLTPVEAASFAFASSVLEGYAYAALEEGAGDAGGPCGCRAAAAAAEAHAARLPCDVHADLGLLTLVLPARGCPGLELFDPVAGAWRQVEGGAGPAPGPGSAVLFAGEQLRAHSGDRLPSAPHRVVLRGPRCRRLSALCRINADPRAARVSPARGPETWADWFLHASSTRLSVNKY
eukprot:tig00000788_g4077.t1